MAALARRQERASARRQIESGGPAARHHGLAYRKPDTRERGEGTTACCTSRESAQTKPPSTVLCPASLVAA